jgi:hypothetical protein
MNKVDFFEIPIYRVSKEDFNKELFQEKRKIEKSLDYILEEFPDKFDNKVNEILDLKSYCYDYNEIIGWIVLFTYGNQIRGEYYFEKDLKKKNNLKNKINRGLRAKRFGLIGKAFAEISVKDNFTNISEQLIERLESINENNELLKNRYIDIHKLKNIVKYIDWQALIKKSK